MALENLFSDNTQKLEDVILAGGQFTTFNDFVVEAETLYRIRSWAIFGGNAASALYLYVYTGVFDFNRVVATGRGLTAVIEGGSGYINPINRLLNTNEKIAVLLGMVAPATGVRVCVELDFAPATRR